MNETSYTIDRPAGLDTWFAWRGTPKDGEVIATGALDMVVKAVERDARPDREAKGAQ
jgi:hypothetical protein